MNRDGGAPADKRNRDGTGCHHRGGLLERLTERAKSKRLTRDEECGGKGIRARWNVEPGVTGMDE